MNKRLLAMGLTALMLMGTMAACNNNANTDTTESTDTVETEIVTEEAIVEKTATINPDGQLLDANGNVIETQAVVDESAGETKVVDKQGNEIVKNSNGQIIVKKRTILTNGTASLLFVSVTRVYIRSMECLLLFWYLQ